METTSLSQIRDGGEFELFVPLTKINEKTGEFEAWATIEEIDQSGEIIDLDKSWPYFEALADRFSKVTKGANFGPLREQHDPNKAAGHLIAPPVIKTHESGARGIYINGLLTDAGTQKKMNAKTLTGVSIGGHYIGEIEKVKVGNREAKKFVADPNHYGVVDAPCVKNALVTVVKADGTQSVEKLIGFNPPQGFLCRASSFHERKEDARICKSDHAPAGPSVETQELQKAELKKGLYGVSRLVCILAELLSARSDAQYEATWDLIAGESPDSNVMDRLTEAAQSIFDALEAILADERAELGAKQETATSIIDAVTDSNPVMEMSTVIGALKKSASAKQLLKSLRVHTGNGSSNTKPIEKEAPVETKKEETKKEEAKAEVTKTAETGELSKAATDQISKVVGETLAKGLEPFAAKVDAIEKAQTKSNDDLGRLVKFVNDKIVPVVKSLASAPAAPRGVKRVTKSEDGKGAEADHSKAEKSEKDKTPLEKMADATSKPLSFQFETGLLRGTAE